MRASLLSSAVPTAKTSALKPPPEEASLFATKLILHTFPSWSDAAHAVNGFYKSIKYSCEGPFGNITRIDADYGVHEDDEPAVSNL